MANAVLSSRQLPRPVAAIALAAGVVALLVYGRGLEDAPVYLTKDEASYGIQAHAIATTGHDTNGRRLPIMFAEPGFNIGRDPIYIYATALVLQFKPLTQGALRIPIVVAAAISIALLVVIAYEMYGSITLAAIAGALLAVTPAFFIRSRAALAVLLPVPFQLIWLLGLVRYSRDGRMRHMVMGSAALGIGVYAYLSMMFFAPLHLAFSLIETLRRRQWRHGVIAVAVFAATLIPLAGWQLRHPPNVNEVATSYRVYPAGLTPLQGLKDVMSWSSLTRRSDIYWGAFNPSRLFFSGESSLVDSTRMAGLLPLAYIVLLPIGLYLLVSRLPSTVPAAIVAVFLLAPLPGVLVGEDTIGRYLIICPLAALVAAGALQWLWHTRSILARGAAVAMVGSTAYLFTGFYADYLGEWRVRSASYLGGNLRGAMERVLSPQQPAPELVFLSERIPYVNVYWEFYRRSAGREDLAGRVRGLSLALDDWRAPAGNVVAIIPGGDDPSADALKAAGWHVAAEVTEFYGGPPIFYVMSRS